MIGRRAGLGLFVAILGLLVLYGLATEPDERTVAGIGPVEMFSCAPPQEVEGFLIEPVPTPAPRPPRGTVPDTFTPVEAVVCDNGLNDHVSADGTTGYIERRYAGDFTSAIEELNAPSERRSLFTAACGDYSLPAQVDMWLVDAQGNAMEPSHPLSDCGFEKTAGLYEVELLDEIGSTEHDVRIDAAGVGLFFSCSPILTSATPGTLSANDFRISSSGFCRFDASGPAPVFLGADTRDTPIELADARPVEPCSERASTIATTSTFGAASSNWAPVELQVELDGCRRMLADGYLPLTAPDDVITAITDSD